MCQFGKKVLVCSFLSFLSEEFGDRVAEGVLKFNKDGHKDSEKDIVIKSPCPVHHPDENGRRCCWEIKWKCIFVLVHI